MSTQSGLNLAEAPDEITNASDRNEREINAALARFGEQKRVQIVFVIIPDSGPTYAKVKQIAEFRAPIGIITFDKSKANLLQSNLTQTFECHRHFMYITM